VTARISLILEKARGHRRAYRRLYVQSPWNETIMNKTIFRPRVWTVSIVAAVTASISMSPHLASSAVSEQVPATAPAIHWTYEGETGPKHWGALSKDFAECSTGREQSPINITKPARENLRNIVFNYRPAKVSVENTGHTIQVDYSPGNSIEVNGSKYELVQFHFHAPSEHTLNGKHADAELHLVHKSASGQLAVVGVFINKGSENRALKPVFDNLPTRAGTANNLDQPVNPESLLPIRRTTYRYEGSLTTPPCSEGVTWLIMTAPIQLSPKQLATFDKLFKGNDRPVQPLNGRTLIEDTSR
jgi:carbonic anhydrase